MAAVEVGARLEAQDDLLQCGVARPLADAVDRALDLPHAGPYRGQRIGHCKAQIVMIVR